MNDSKDNTSDDEKIQKQRKKMTKIMGKIWNFHKADSFHEERQSSSFIDLKYVGQKLDKGSYLHGRRGWEKFSGDIGMVFNQHIQRKNKSCASAKDCLEYAVELLRKIDESLVTKAVEAVPIDTKKKEIRATTPDEKKRKLNDFSLMNSQVPKKRSIRSEAQSRDTLTLTQKEEKAIDELMEYVEEHGGDRQQVSSYHVKILNRNSKKKDEIYFFSPQGDRFKKKSDIVQFLGLTTESKSKSSKQTNHNSRSRKVISRTTINKTKPRNSRESESEKKRLKKELEKLNKAHLKLIKSLDECKNDFQNNTYPMNDDFLFQEKRDSSGELLQSPFQYDVSEFRGFPVHCVGDLLMVWDFLCKFSNLISLTPIEFEDFVSALSFSSCFESKKELNDPISQEIPVYVSEIHLALLKLLLKDVSSDEWWWSTLDSDQTELNENDEFSREVINEISDIEMPSIKFDFASLVSFKEDPMCTTQWLETLEKVKFENKVSMKKIKKLVKESLSLTSNESLKTYLIKVIAKYQSSEAMTKKSIIWLTDKIREVRPDLTGQDVSEGVNEQLSKIVASVNTRVESISENDDDFDIDAMELELYEDMEDDDSDSEVRSGGGNENDKSIINQKMSNNHFVKEETIKVASAIPVKPAPTIVDLLLPPQKPTLNSDIITPLTWPAIVGASACRILHRYKRQRNEVDDELRESIGLPPLTITERRNRERRGAQRVFSECAAGIQQNDKVFYPMETAIESLCNGGLYTELSPVQKLCILRILVEAAYDTHRVNKCITENIKSRVNAVKLLETEEKRVKREAKEEMERLSLLAGERLSNEAKAKFLAEKRIEISRANKFKDGEVNDLTDEDIIHFNEDTQAKYNALPMPGSFNKSELNEMISRINEESCFDYSPILVLTMDEVQARETENVDRSDLFSTRTNAVEKLLCAIEGGTIKGLKEAIKIAKQAHLTGPEDSIQGMWVLDVLRDAALALKAAERRREIVETQKEVKEKLNKCFIRKEPIGKDRHRHRFWLFESDSGDKIFSETLFNLNVSNIVAIIQTKDEEDDFITKKSTKDHFSFCRKEYHHIGREPGLPDLHWGCQVTEQCLRTIVKGCDNRGIRESALKSAIKTIIESKMQGLDKNDLTSDSNDNGIYRSNGDEEAFEEAIKLVESMRNELSGITSAIGQRIRIKEVLDDSTDTIIKYEMGTIIGWKLGQNNALRSNHQAMQSTEVINDNSEEPKVPLWNIFLDKGSEIQLFGPEIVEGIICARRWKNPQSKIVEEDNSFLLYRNNLGRFCGRQAEAPHAVTPFSFCKQMIKQEERFYSSLRNRNLYNEWDMKTSARKTWINTLRQPDVDFEKARDGLLTYENALFKLSGGIDDTLPDGSKLLLDDNYRFDIELESITKTPDSLWNSTESRAVFIEIISASRSVQILALGLDLMTRNCDAYIKATKSVIYDSSDLSSSRRQNAWQKKKNYLRY